LSKKTKADGVCTTDSSWRLLWLSVATNYSA